jgi:putative serine protease PepD
MTVVSQTAGEPEPIAPVEEPAPKRTSKVPIAVIAALAIGALIGGTSGAGLAVWATALNAAPVDGTSTATTITVNDAADATQITAAAAKASPSVVTISVSSDQASGTGSGVVLSADGYVLTNTHVVTLDGAVAHPTVRVQTNDGLLFTATVVGTDPISDLAVIKLEGSPKLHPAKFANSAKLNVGDTAIAIGAPLGLAGTVTTGIVSALNRSITIASSAAPKETGGTNEAPPTNSPFDFWNFSTPGQTPAPTSSATISLSVLQTDAAINPGNSGGALLNSDGDVIGINVAIASASGSAEQSGSIGVGFAIPSNLAQRIAKELRADGKATHGLLGASVADVTEDKAQTNSKLIGASIVELTPGGAAEKAGLKVGDIITKLDGIPITGKTDLTAQVRSLPAGSSATVTYVRGSKADAVKVTLGALQ